MGDTHSWKCKKQDRVSKSSTKTEYRAMSTSCSEVVRLSGLCAELGISQLQSTHLYGDNTIQIMANSMYYERTKHIEIHCHYIMDAYDSRVITHSMFPLLNKLHISSPNL